MMVGHSVTLNIDRPKYDAPVPRLTLKGITCYDGEGVKRLDNVSFTALGGEILASPASPVPARGSCWSHCRPAPRG